MKELRCRDVGLDCDAVIRAETEEEVMRQAAEHARKEHGMTNIGEEDQRKMRSKIRAV
ncbi:MAG: DUF1059 domain-containing protein [Gemmatimonadetes bacterium]|nr:DUF1059 domain-containing protein [Gemmatimonadota bacterium]